MLRNLSIHFCTVVALTTLAGCDKSEISGAALASRGGAQQSASSTGPVRILSALPPAGTSTTEADREGRLAIKRGADYVPINEDPETLFDRLEHDMSQRRQVGWKIVESMLAPQKLQVDGMTIDVPLWHTWYEGGSKNTGNAEVNSVIDLYVDNLKKCRDRSCGESETSIAERTLVENSTKDLGESLTHANMNQTLLQLKSLEETDPTGKRVHLGQGFTMFSPSFVEHVLTQAHGIEGCELRKESADTAPRTASQFSYCFDEFPRSAVMVKTQWSPIGDGGDVRAFDTSGPALERQLGSLNGKWSPGKSAGRSTSTMYSVKADDGETYGLNAIHFSTKDTREWIWVTLWWDPQPNNDFGADRPASINGYNQGVWRNYKMCVSSAFNEMDPAPWKSYEKDSPSLAASIKGSFNAMSAAAKGSPPPFDQVTSWCSNPYVEGHINNDKTNCIGCHQYSITQSEATSISPARKVEFSDTIWLLASQPLAPIPEKSRADYAKHFPQLGRSRIRNNFPADFAWSTYFEFPEQITNARKVHHFEWDAKESD
jgi:hypothetical protein